MNAHAPTLDIEKFRKVVALMQSGSTEGERASARGRAEAVAAKAGLSLDAALSVLDAQKPAPIFRNIFEGFDDWMEGKEPGYKARRAAEHAEKKRRDDLRRAEIRAKHGSVDAILDRTKQEEALRNSVRGLGVWDSWEDKNTGKFHPYARRLDGQEHCYTYADLTPAIIRTVTRAYPIPVSLAGVLQEHQDWRRLELDRDLAIDGEWQHYLEVEARIAVLEEELNSRPAANWDDLAARMKWWRIEIDWEISRTREENHAFRLRVSEDIEILRFKSETRKRSPRRDRAAADQPDLFE